ncbi:MAG: hypothetical protein ACTTKL_05510 [Treponema sp.]
MKKIRLLSVFLMAYFGFAQTTGTSSGNLESLIQKTQENPESYEAWFDLGVKYHSLANSEVKGAADKAVEALQKAHDIRNDPLSLSWLGSAWTLKGDDAKNPINKIDYVLKGAKMMDEAVSQAENDVVVRRVRIETFDALPVFFAKKQTVEDDLVYLIKLYEKSPDAFDNIYDPAWAVYYYGTVLIRNGNLKKGRKYVLLAKKIVKAPEIEAKIDKLI